MSLASGSFASIVTPGAAVGLIPEQSVTVVDLGSPAEFDTFEITLDAVEATEIVFHAAAGDVSDVPDVHQLYSQSRT